MWNIQRNTLFLAHLKKKVGYYYEDSIVDLKLVKGKNYMGLIIKNYIILLKFHLQTIMLLTK